MNKTLSLKYKPQIFNFLIFPVVKAKNPELIWLVWNKINNDKTQVNYEESDLEKEFKQIQLLCASSCLSFQEVDPPKLPEQERTGRAMEAEEVKFQAVDIKLFFPFLEYFFTRWSFHAVWKARCGRWTALYPSSEIQYHKLWSFQLIYP